ncbi:MAG TPA: DUF192 domain-containing protein [Candidatus Saccharimonadales bacterium]|nr:DUF192 domain-containing protein [Candidatus Saccharimonadales bacterium]
MKILKAKQARTFLEKSKGLLGEKESYPLFFQTRWGIHTFGMRFPIDVVILTDDYTVYKVKQNLKANHFFFWNPIYKNVLELPEGTIQKEKLELKERIKLIFQ